MRPVHASEWMTYDQSIRRPALRAARAYASGKFGPRLSDVTAFTSHCRRAISNLPGFLSGLPLPQPALLIISSLDRYSMKSIRLRHS